MTRRPTALLLAAAIAATVPLAGCGGGGKERSIPRDDGKQLIHLLRQARDAAGDRDRCDELQQAITAARAQVDSLPASVEGDTRESLDNGIGNLQDRASQDCEDVATDKKPTKTTPTVTVPTVTETTPTETQTTPTETTPTETQPTETQPTETQPTETQEPPDQTVPAPSPPPGRGNGGAQGTPGQDKKGKKPKKANK